MIVNGGEYECKFNISNGIKSSSYNVQFTVEFAKNKSGLNGSLSDNSNGLHNFIAPIPSIVRISNRGIVFVKWNVEM